MYHMRGFGGLLLFLLLGAFHGVVPFWIAVSAGSAGIGLGFASYFWRLLLHTRFGR